MANAKPTKPTNLVRVNDSMIHDTKQPGLKAVTLGLRDNEGNQKVGTIFVSEKQINADRRQQICLRVSRNLMLH